jgi:hypothetical protein
MRYASVTPHMWRKKLHVYACYITEWYIDGQWSSCRVAIRLLAFISFSVPEWAHHNRYGVWQLNNRTDICTEICRNGNMHRVSAWFNSTVSNKRWVFVLLCGLMTQCSACLLTQCSACMGESFYSHNFRIQSVLWIVWFICYYIVCLFLK